MELRNFFVSLNDVSDGLVTVTGDEFRHMTRVLRLKRGFKAFIMTNDGIRRLCTITDIEAERALLSVDCEERIDSKNKRLTLFCSVLKNNKLDLVIQKCTELGADEIIPFVSENSAEKSFNRPRAEKIALEAAKQCGSAYIPKIGDPISFGQIFDKTQQFGAILFAYEKERRNKIADVLSDADSVAVIVGPEGGFSDKEAELALSRKALSVTLGKRILRAETASIAAAALALEYMGELDYE